MNRGYVTPLLASIATTPAAISFGSLDPKTLETALSTLDSIQSAGRKVGLISHVPGLAERIGVQVLVERQGQGASTVRVVAGGV